MANFRKINEITNEFVAGTTIQTDANYYKNNFKEICSLGSDGFSTVFKSAYNFDNKMYAIKKVCYTSENEKLLSKELKVLSQHNSDFVVKYLNSWTEFNYYIGSCNKQYENGKSSSNFLCCSKLPLLLHIQMELCPFSLRDYISIILKEFVTPDNHLSIIGYYVSIELFYEIIECLNYLHSQNPSIVHRDLKPENVLINIFDNQRFVKITDFGISQYNEIADQSHIKCVGATNYRAFEVNNKGRYTTKADIFSLGVIIQEMFNFEISDSNRQNISELDNKFVYLVDLTEKLLAFDPFKRPSCAKIFIELDKMRLSQTYVLNNSRFFEYLTNTPHSKRPLTKENFVECFIQNKLEDLNIKKMKQDIKYTLNKKLILTNKNQVKLEDSNEKSIKKKTTNRNEVLQTKQNNNDTPKLNKSVSIKNDAIKLKKKLNTRQKKIKHKNLDKELSNFINGDSDKTHNFYYQFPQLSRRINVLLVGRIGTGISTITESILNFSNANTESQKAVSSTIYFNKIKSGYRKPEFLLDEYEDFCKKKKSLISDSLNEFDPVNLLESLINSLKEFQENRKRIKNYLMSVSYKSNSPFDKSAPINKPATIDKRTPINKQALIDKRGAIGKWEPIDKRSSIEKREPFYKSAPFDTRVPINKRALIDKRSAIIKWEPIDKRKPIVKRVLNIAMISEKFNSAYKLDISRNKMEWNRDHGQRLKYLSENDTGQQLENFWSSQSNKKDYSNKTCNTEWLSMPKLREFNRHKCQDHSTEEKKLNEEGTLTLSKQTAEKYFLNFEQKLTKLRQMFSFYDDDFPNKLSTFEVKIIKEVQDLYSEFRKKQMKEEAYELLFWKLKVSQQTFFYILKFFNGMLNIPTNTFIGFGRQSIFNDMKAIIKKTETRDKALEAKIANYFSKDVFYEKFNADYKSLQTTFDKLQEDDDECNNTRKYVQDLFIVLFEVEEQKGYN